MSALNEWRAALDECPSPDYNLLTALADWLDDHDRPTDAAGIRWIIRVETWPTHVTDEGEVFWAGGDIPYDIAGHLPSEPLPRDESAKTGRAFERFLMAWNAMPDDYIAAIQKWRRMKWVTKC